MAEGEGGDTLFTSASAEEAETLVLDLGAYEGPLDVLLDLAKAQKVDLREISILELAEQYLVFIAAVKRKRLDIAAEYLVMAAYLAYLKSRLLLPAAPNDEEPSGPEMAAHLAFQLERLQAMRRAAEDLFDRARLGRNFFARGEPERRSVTTRTAWRATQHELLMAYARQRTKENYAPLHLERRAVVAIDEALLRLRAALGERLGATLDWIPLESFLPDEWRDEQHARSAIASTFAASLELTKHGRALLRQEEPFAPLFIQARASPARAEDAASEGANPLRARLEQAQAEAPRAEAAPEAGDDAGRERPGRAEPARREGRDAPDDQKPKRGPGRGSAA